MVFSEKYYELQNHCEKMAKALKGLFDAQTVTDSFNAQIDAHEAIDEYNKFKKSNENNEEQVK